MRIRLRRGVGQDGSATAPPFSHGATVGYPAHAEKVDFDGGGKQELLIAEPGRDLPENHIPGKVSRRIAAQRERYWVHPILENVGRVADIRRLLLTGTSVWRSPPAVSC